MTEREIPTTETVTERLCALLGSDWDGADWTHERDPQPDCTHADHDPADGCPMEYCDGDDVACRTCQAAARDASEADGEFWVAVEAAEAGDWARARSAIRTAYRLEDAYGDAPRYWPVLDEIERLAEAARHAR